MTAPAYDHQYYYIPKTKPISGYDFTAPQLLDSAPASTVNFDNSAVTDTSNPPDRQIIFLKRNADSNYDIGFAFGYSPYGDTSASSRSANASSDYWWIYTSKKTYPEMINWYQVGIINGKTYDAYAYRQWIDPTVYDIGKSAYWHTVDGHDLIYVDYHRSATNDVTTLPTKYAGRVIHVLDSLNVATSQTSIPGNCQLQLSTSSGSNGYFVADLLTPANVSLTSSVNPTMFGASTTLTATVTPSSATGAVIFLDGATSLGTATLGHGSGSVAVSNLAVGSHSLTAVYRGDTNDGGSTSPGITQTVNQASTTTALSTTPPSPAYGQNVTLIASVSPSGATGTFTFKDGSKTISTANVDHGSGSYTVTTLSVGSHSFTAVYSGDSTYLTSTSSPAPVTVGQATTTTTLTSSVNPTTYGQSSTLTASVSPSQATGTVTFKDGSTTVGTATLSHGSGTLAISSLTVGSHSLTAVYSGDTNDATSTSNTVTQALSKASTTTTLASSLTPSNLGQLVTFTAIVTPSTATGTVTINGSTPLGTITLVHGVGSLSTSDLRLGSQTVTATYNGGTAYVTSTSNTLTQIVNGSSSSSTSNAGGGGTRRAIPNPNVSSSSSRATTSGIVARSSSSATPSSERWAPTTPVPSSPLSTITATTNLRASPSAKAALIVTLQSGWQVTVESIDGQWAKVRTASGKEGYVLAKNVPVTPLPPLPSPPLITPSSGQTRTTTISLKLHVTPIVTSATLTTFSPNTTLQLLSVQGDWAEVQFTWHHGWVVRKYLR
jgi:SH3-like domain-containing protein